MAYQAVQHRRTEFQFRVRLFVQVEPNLAQAEQVEVIDQEGAEQNQQPAKGERHVQQDLRMRIPD